MEGRDITITLEERLKPINRHGSRTGIFAGR